MPRPELMPANSAARQNGVPLMALRCREFPNIPLFVDASSWQMDRSRRTPREEWLFLTDLHTGRHQRTISDWGAENSPESTRQTSKTLDVSKDKQLRFHELNLVFS